MAYRVLLNGSRTGEAPFAENPIAGASNPIQGSCPANLSPAGTVITVVQNLTSPRGVGFEAVTNRMCYEVSWLEREEEELKKIIGSSC